MAPSQETTTSPPPSSLPKRSKGKLFQCTGYPGCSMVFTRSEHLARHIRKHTGERPFQCNFCMKKFSRLDNLRQHKQTVHQFENSHTHGNDPDNDASSACTELPKTKPGASFLPQNADGAITYKNQHKVGMHYGINKHQHAYIHPHNYSHYQNLTHNQFLQREIGNMEHLQQNMVGHELKDESFSLTPSSEINPQTPSFNNRLPGMISPPNSVSRHVHVNIQKSMLPPPRQNILLHKPGNGFSDVRPALANKPVPIIIDNSNNELHSTNNNQLAINKLMTPTTANGTSMDISPVPIHLNQFKQQQNSPGIPVFQNTPNSTFSSPLVSPSMSSFGESAPSPHNLAFVLQQQQQQQMYSNSLTPTNSNFEYRNGPYLSPLYYQRTPLHPQYHLPPIPQQMHCVPSYNASMRQKENTPYGINDMHAIDPRNGMKGMAVVNGMNSDKNMNGLQVNQTNYYSYYNYGGFNNELNHSNQITSIRHVAPKQQKKSPLINSSILISPSAESVDGHKGEEPEDGDNEKENEKKIPQTTSDEDECKVNGKDSRHNPKNVRNDTNESCTDKNACKITTEMANQIGTDDKETLSNEKGLSPKPTKHISPIIEIVDTDAGMVKSTPNSLALDPHSAVDKRPVLANLLNG